MDLDKIMRLFAALEREKVRYAVFGDVALGLLGLPRATEDLDLEGLRAVGSRGEAVRPGDPPTLADRDVPRHGGGMEGHDDQPRGDRLGGHRRHRG